MGKIVAVANQKGGVGKTTTSVNLSAALVSLGYRVLLVDLDAQGNATMGCGVNKHQLGDSAYEVLTGKAFVGDVIVNVDPEGFDLLPGNSDLTAVQVELMSRIGRERVLSEALAVCRDDYHFVVIDCPPALNILTLNALVAADSILIPMQCEYYALEGLSDLLGTMENVRDMINPDLHVEGLLRTMHDTRSRLAAEVSSQLLQHFGGQVFDTIVPRNVRLAEAPSHGLSILQYDRGSKGAQAYLALAEEIIRRNQ
ncbi:MAG: ParA family protein [Methylococcus sp.]|jgi:chromosome partitioning protein|nr:MAG: ParA family protein [Methylococcus sp.]